MTLKDKVRAFQEGNRRQYRTCPVSQRIATGRSVTLQSSGLCFSGTAKKSEGKFKTTHCTCTKGVRRFNIAINQVFFRFLELQIKRSDDIVKWMVSSLTVMLSSLCGDSECLHPFHRYLKSEDQKAARIKSFINGVYT